MISETDFEEFYTRNYKSVYRICYVYLKDKAEAEDAAADVFLKALTGSAEFNGGERERGWLAVTAMNLCKDRLKHWWWKKRAAVENVDDFSSKDGGRDETLEKVLSLPAKYKDVVYLFYYLGYKTDEIAKTLGEKPSTVRNRLRDARIILKKELEADDFKELGIYFSLPDGAENAEYYIIDGDIARVIFSVDGAEYTVSASSQSGDFSGVTDESVGSETIDSESGAVLETLGGGEYKARWSDGKITYYITASGDVEKDDFLSVAEKIIASTR